jgi:hypothetical protein
MKHKSRVAQQSQNDTNGQTLKLSDSYAPAPSNKKFLRSPIFFKKKQISDNNLKPVLASIEYKISSDFNNKFMKGETTNT